MLHMWLSFNAVSLSTCHTALACNSIDYRQLLNLPQEIAEDEDPVLSLHFWELDRGMLILKVLGIAAFQLAMLTGLHGFWWTPLMRCSIGGSLGPAIPAMFMSCSSDSLAQMQRSTLIYICIAKDSGHDPSTRYTCNILVIVGFTHLEGILGRRVLAWKMVRDAAMLYVTKKRVEGRFSQESDWNTSKVPKTTRP
ncbi:hypothetical protein EV363DRAFT_1294395 [Boletus edulis]|nr:hypothetical protein EV363DRAFT_1294395 [Boletus edulis]